MDMKSKTQVRQELRSVLNAMSEADRHQKSLLACGLLLDSEEFHAARVVMLYLSMPDEVDTSPLALRAWQEGKSVVVPKVSWDQRRMMPVEIHSLQASMTMPRPGLREPMAGQPIPVEFIDLVIVPGLGFSSEGARIGRGMGFYDRFLAQEGFAGLACGLAFEDQVIQGLPTLDHDALLHMLVTDQSVRRFGPAKGQGRRGERAKGRKDEGDCVSVS